MGGSVTGWCARSRTRSPAICCSPVGTSPREALEYGLIGHVVPDGRALDRALEIAEVIAGNGPLAVQAILRSIRETEGMHENEAFKIDTKIGIEVFLSEDAKEVLAGLQGEARAAVQDALGPTPARTVCEAIFTVGAECETSFTLGDEEGR